MIDWPAWFDWELELSQHLLKRMIDRRFSEIDLREMLEDATGYHPDIEEGRLAIETRHGNRKWIVVVEPFEQELKLLVVTAFSID
jgi:hypothetical protein